MPTDPATFETLKQERERYEKEAKDYSERLRLAKQFFDEGKISEADNVLKEKEMAAAGDAALAMKARNFADKWGWAAIY
ncbi:MAG: hypothetical protein AABZ16_14545, partial [candidate division NC10 bacterium]